MNRLAIGMVGVALSASGCARPQARAAGTSPAEAERQFTEVRRNADLPITSSCLCLPAGK